jgi:hypothetical protein
VLKTKLNQTLELVQKCVVKLCMYKTEITSFTLSDVFIKSFDCVKDCNVILDNKLHFNSCSLHILSGTEDASLIHYITYNLSSLNYLIVLYTALIWSSHEYTCVILY